MRPPRNGIPVGGGFSREFWLVRLTRDTSRIPVSGTLRILTPMQLWRQQNFGTHASAGNAADAADPDGEGVQNSVEYGLGMAPNQKSLTGLPVRGRINVAGSDYLTLTFARPIAATDVECRFLTAFQHLRFQMWAGIRPG